MTMADFFGVIRRYYLFTCIFFVSLSLNIHYVVTLSSVKLHAILVVCNEDIEWVQNFRFIEVSLTVYTKCGHLGGGILKQLDTIGAKVVNGPQSHGYATKSLHTYVSDMIERKQSEVMGEDNTLATYLYMRPSIFYEFDTVRKGTKRIMKRNSTREKNKTQSFFSHLALLTKSTEVLSKIGFLEFGDTGARSFDCVDFKQKRFPSSVARQWKKDGLMCQFRGFPRNHFFISARYLHNISLDILFEVRKALDESKKKKNTRKLNRNYFTRKLEQMWDGLMGCGLYGNKNFCDNCGNLKNVEGYGPQKLYFILKTDMEECETNKF